MANNNETSDRAAAYTDIQEQFLNLLRKYPIKNPETVVDYVSSQGETVLEDPEMLARALGECEIPPVRRRQVLKHWFAEKGIEVEADLLRRVALPPDIKKRTEEAEREDKAKYSVDTTSGTIKVATTTDKTALTWDEAQNLASTIKKELTEKGKAKPPTYVYDTETGQVRMAKEGEVGGTLEQAKELMKLAPDVKKKTEEEEAEKKEKEKAKYSVDTESGAIKVATTTDKTALTWDEAQNLASTIKKELTEKGKARAPIYIYDTETRQVRMAKEGEAGGTLEQAKELKKMGEGEAVDPLEQLAQTAEKMRFYQEAFGGGARGMPEWMSDPAKFIEMVRTISGGGKEDEAVEKQLAELRQTIDTMREEKFLSMVAAQHQQLQALGAKIEELGKPVTGRTDMDIIHEIATAGIGLAQTELTGLRRDIKEVMRSAELPVLKTPEQREDRKRVYRKSLARDASIEKLGRSLFFGEGDATTSEVEVKKVPHRQASIEIYLYDPETKQVRTAKEGEAGGTLEQADEAKRAAEVQALAYE